MKLIIIPREPSAHSHVPDDTPKKPTPSKLVSAPTLTIHFNGFNAINRKQRNSQAEQSRARALCPKTLKLLGSSCIQSTLRSPRGMPTTVGSIYTYALIKALYDEGEDYIDSFWPIVVKTIPSNQSVTSSFVQRKLRESCDLEAPLHVLEVILTRAERRKYLQHWTEPSTDITKYRLTSVGIDYSGKLETEKEVERRINALLESMRQFIEGKGVSLDLDKIRESLLYFVHKNIDFLAEYIAPSKTLIKLTPPEFLGFDRYLLEYIESAKVQKPDDYKTLENLVFGSIISVLLQVNKPEEITKIRDEPFSHCQVFLDTNFVFSLLGLHSDVFNEPAKELLNLLKEHNFDLKVFGFTVDEICRVINSYPEESYRYPASIQVDTLYSSLKAKGWSDMDARQFIINIEQILQQKGITIEWFKDIDLGKYKPDKTLTNVIRRYKPDQNPFHRNHDLAAIAKIKELRKKTIRRIEDSGVLFLTSDIGLHKFDFIEEGHKQNATICETILDRLMTNILWLKNPNTKLSLETIIAAHSRNLFINRRIWDRFYQVLQGLKRDGKIGDNDLATLFWHNYLEDTLRPIEESESKVITSEFVLEKIEEAGKLREQAIKQEIKGIEETKEKEMEIELRKKEEEFSEALKRSTSDIELRKEKEWLEKIQNIKGKLREVSDAKARRWSNIYTLLLALVVVAIVTIAYYSIPYDILDLILTLIGGGGIIGLWKLRHNMSNWLTKRIYRQKLEEAELDKIP